MPQITLKAARPSRADRFPSRVLRRRLPTLLAVALLPLAGPVGCTDHSDRFKIHKPYMQYNYAGPREAEPPGLKSWRGMIMVDRETGESWYLDASQGPHQIQWRRLPRAGAPVQQATEATDED